VGQSNLIIVLFTAIIVTIAIALGIELYQNHVRKANEDALRRDILVMLNATAEWYTRPKIYKGGGRSFDNLTCFGDLGYYYNSDYTPTTGVLYFNENGTFKMIPGTNELVIVGSLDQDSDVLVAYKIFANQINFTLEIVEITKELEI